jgi:hypothetical protein
MTPSAFSAALISGPNPGQPSASTTVSGPPAPAPAKLHALVGVWSMIQSSKAGGPVPASSVVPLKPALESKRAELERKLKASEVILGRNSRCIPSGMPDMMGFGFNAWATADYLVVYGGYGTVRPVWLNRSVHTPANQLFPTYQGESIGRWEADTLVVDTVGLEATNEITYGLSLDDPDMHIVERWRLRNPRELEVVTTIASEKSLTRPWTYTVVYGRRPSSELVGPITYCDQPLVNGSLNLTPPIGGYIPPGAADSPLDAGPGPAQVPEVNHSRECDSQCLRGHADRYMAAYAKHDPSALQVNPTLRASENSHAVALGDNSWNTARVLRPEQVVLTDPFSGQVITMGVLEMRGAEPFIYSVRLKIENNRISESEIMTVSDKTSGVHFRPDLMNKSYKEMNAELPAAQRMTRAELLKGARVTWSLDAGTQPLRAVNCLHYENWESPDGGSGCRGGGRNPREIRVPLVDVDKGVVVAYQLEDFTNPSTGNGPPSEANSKLPLFYYQPITFYVMKTAKFGGGQYLLDSMFMSSQEHGVETVFRR